MTSNAATGYVAKISMLRLNIGSGKLSSCMLSIGRGPKAVRGKGGRPPLPCSHLGPRPMLSMHELSLPEPMLSLSMLILATCPEHAQECSEHCSARSERSARSEHFWIPGTLFGYDTVAGKTNLPHKSNCVRYGFYNYLRWKCDDLLLRNLLCGHPLWH